jgi:hypothetical protein
MSYVKSEASSKGSSNGKDGAAGDAITPPTENEEAQALDELLSTAHGPSSP